MNTPDYELIAGYVLGDLSPEEAQDFMARLAARPDVQAAIADLQASLAEAYDPPLISPPAHLRAQVLSQHQQVLTGQVLIGQALGGETGSGENPLPVSETLVGEQMLLAPRPWLRAWVRGVGVAAIVILGWNNWRLWQQVQSLRLATGWGEIAPGEVFSAEIRPGETNVVLQVADQAIAPEATAHVRIGPGGRVARLEVEGLPPLPPGKVYVLWTVVEEGAPFTVDQVNAVLTQVFQVDSQGKVTRSFELPLVYRSLGLVRAIAITQEEATAPQLHNGQPLLISPLES